MSRFFGLSLTAGAFAMIAVSALADGHVTKAQEDAIKARKALMGVVSYHTGLLGSIAKGETPYDAATATAAAENLAAAASMNPSVLWIEGTAQGTVADTRAKAEIWTDWAGFGKHFGDLQEASSMMVEAAGTDLASLQASMKGIGDACGACHKAFRGPQN
jgi:cytochrome c556